MAQDDDTQRLVLEMSADLKRFEKGLDRANAVGSKRLSQIERRFDRAGRNMAGSFALSANSINQSIAGIAVGAAIVQIGRYADAWTEAGNKLAAAGVPAEQLAGRQRELVQLANDTRTALAPTVDLYARLMRSTEGLGASQELIARATEITNKAFKAGGAAASEQAAGILQLGQALGSGVLQGDELRSLRENAPLIAQAIADEFGTTIAGLKELGAEGKLTSDRVFAAIIAGGAKIDAQFARTDATIGDSFTRLRNEAGLFVGQLDDATNASATLSAFIVHVSENLETLAAAAVVTASVLGGVLAGQAVVGMIASLTKGLQAIGLTTAAIQAMGLRSAVAAGGVNALKAALAFFGGPIGIAVTGIAIALGLLAGNAAAAALETQQVADALDSQAAAAGVAAEETAKLTGEITSTQTWAASLTGETDKLADAHYRAAAAAKAQAIETARLRLVQARDTLDQTRERFDERRRTNAINAGTISTPYGTAGNIGGGRYSEEGDRRSLASQEYADLVRSTAIVRAEVNNVRGLMAETLSSERFAPPRFNRTGGDTEEKGGKGKERSAEAAEREARARRDQLASIAAANAIQIATFRDETNALAVLERQEMIRERINALMQGGLTEAEATTRAAADQRAYDEARAEAIARVVADRQAELALQIAVTDEDIEQIRFLEAKAELRDLTRQYIDDGLTRAEAETKALADQVRLEEARIRARGRYMALNEADRQQRLAELRGETLLANQLRRANEVRDRAKTYRDQGGLSPADAEARARAEVIEETTAQARGAFREAFRSGVLEAVRSGDLVGAAAEFAMNASEVLTDKVLNQAADALFDVLSRQFPQLFDTAQELLADTTAASTMATAITTSAATGAASLGGSIATAAGTGAAVIGGAMTTSAATSGGLIAASIVAGGKAAAAIMASAIATASGGGEATNAIAAAFIGGRAGGGPVRYHMRNERGPEPFVPTSHGVIFSNEAMRGLASLGKIASQGGGMGGDLNVEVINATGTPAKVTQERTPGGAKITLEPLFDQALEGAGRSGKLRSAASKSPTPNRRG